MAGLTYSWPVEQQATELIEERRVGTSEGGRDANAALLALSKAARSVLLYDTSNQIIRDFLEELRDRIWAFGEMYGPLDVDVRPFELQREGETVYLERDRERSLAWRMFRDGVRRVVIQPEVDWDELMSLIEILSIRYTGLRQQEDDIVTLLWKAGFVHIEIHSIEGVIRQDVEISTEGPRASATGPVQRWTGPRYDAPPDWDQPLADFEATAEVAYRELGSEELNALRMEQSEAILVPLGMRVAAELLAASSDTSDPTQLQEILPFLREFRDSLIDGGRLDTLGQLVDLLLSHYVPAPPPVMQFVSDLGGTERMLQILETQARHVRPTAELLQLLRRLPEPPFQGLIGVIDAQPTVGVRRLARQLLEPLLPARQQVYVTHTLQAEPQAAADLVRAGANSVPDVALKLAAQLAERGDEALIKEVLLLLERSESGASTTDGLLRLLESSSRGVRLRAIRELTRRVERSAYDHFVGVAETHAPVDLRPDEAHALGMGMAQLLPEVAGEQFEEWIHADGGVLDRLVSGRARTALRYVAVSGFGELPRDARGSRLLHWLSKHSTGELHKHTMKTIVKRRKELHGR